MDSAVVVAGVATVLGAFQLLPQLIRSVRVGSTAGLSGSWAAIGVVLNVAWIGYRSAQELWISLPSPIITALLYGALLLLVMRSSPNLRSMTLWATTAVGSLTIAGVIGGWPLVGTALSIGAAIQIAPAVWSAFRTRGPLAIAPGLWIVGLAQATLWGYFGHHVGDRALLVYGWTIALGSAAILIRYALHRVTPPGRSGVAPGRLARSATALRALASRG